MPRKQTVKAAFVLQHAEKPPAEIIALAKREGMSLSASYVHLLRLQGASSKSKLTAAQVTVGKRGSAGKPHAEFSQLVVRIGTDRAREWLAALDSSPMAI